jgi:replicative DNA helicase
MELYSLEAEKAVLGAMLLDNKIAEKTALQLRALDFYEFKHQKIFTAMEILAIQKQTIDLVTVCDYLTKHEGMKENGFQYLSDMTTFCASLANADTYIAAIKGYAIRRALVRKAEEIKDIAVNMDKPVQEVYCDILSAVESVKPQNVKSEDEGIKTILMEVLESVDKKTRGEGMGIKTGITSYDRETGGLFPGELTVIGARPGVGKSALAVQLAIGAARREKTVQFFSLEMSREQYGVRVFAYDTGVSSVKMRTGKLDAKDFELFYRTFREYANLPLFISTYARTPLQMRNACLNRGDVGLVVVDYLQLVRPNGKYGNREQEVAAVSRAFKELSLELNIPVVVLSQLRRPEVGNKEPTMSDLRESGAIEQDADNIILLHEPSKRSDPEEQQMLEDCNVRGERLLKVTIEKQRQGSRCYFNLVFRPEKVEFVSLLKEGAE